MIRDPDIKNSKVKHLWRNTDNNNAISSAFGSLNVTNAVFDCPGSLHAKTHKKEATLTNWVKFPHSNLKKFQREKGQTLK